MGDAAVLNQTLYISNLNEKLKKEDLKKCLHAVFSQFGRVIDVVCLKTYRLRGQAWLVFAETASAANALTLMQGFPFFDKPMRISYATSESDAAARQQGREPNKSERSQKSSFARDQYLKKQPAPGVAVAQAATATKAGVLSSSSPQAPAHKILFVESLPPATTEQMLGMLFQQFPGFKEVRLVESRPGIAFAEFDNEVQASVALTGLQGFKITADCAMRVTYAKQ